MRGEQNDDTPGEHDPTASESVHRTARDGNAGALGGTGSNSRPRVRAKSAITGRMWRESLPFGVAAMLACGVGCTQEVTNPFDPGTSGMATETTVAMSTSSSGTDTDTETSESSSESSTTGEPAESSSESSSSGGPIGQQCGNGIIEGTEDCDCNAGPCTAEGLNNTSCVDVKDPLAKGVLTGGTLGCDPASCQFDIDDCTYCGDAELNGNELCELGMPIETSCMELGEGTAGVLTCMKDCQVDTSACTDCGYMFSFEGNECPGEWTVGRTTGAAALPTWQCGDPDNYAQGPGPGKSGVWATNLTGAYSVNESSFLQSGTLDLSNCEGQDILMTLHHWYNFHGLVVNDDGGIVQVSTDGDSWTQIHPSGGSDYPMGDEIAAAYGPVDGADGFGGNNPDERMWVDTQFDLSEYAGESTFYIRFVMGSDDSAQSGGWYIDNLEMLGSGG